MSETVATLNLERDYKKYVYFVDKKGSVCRALRGRGNKGSGEILVQDAVTRDRDYLYFIDKEGNVSRAKSIGAIRREKKAAGVS